MMLLLYVAWVATWQAMYDPRLWTEVASPLIISPADRARLPASLLLQSLGSR